MRAISMLLMGLVVVLAPICRATPARADQPFSAYSEIAFRTGQGFPKWQAIQQRLAEEEGAVQSCLATGDCGSSTAAEIARRLKDVVAQQPLEQAEAVQRMMNARPYKDDVSQFGRNDVWQTPFAFWDNGGDCEDYAIAKYLALRVLGFSEAQLRLTVMTSRTRREVHAVLLVALGEDWYVADNLKRGLRGLDDYGAWKPEFSVSDAGVWRYVARSAAAEQVAAADKPAAPLPEPAGTVATSSQQARSAASIRARL